MKIQKSLTAIGAALMMMGATAHADIPYFRCAADGMPPNPEVIANSIKDLADYLSTNDRLADPNFPDKNFGPWPYDPIWQKAGGESFEVQNALVRKLYERREFSPDSKPPKKKNNDATGAAWDVRNGKYDAAVDKLISFNKDAYKSRLNVWPTGHADPDFQNALDAKDHFVTEVGEAISCICKLTECEL